MKANIFGPTACAMAMQIDLSKQLNKSKGQGHPTKGGVGIPPALRKEIEDAMGRHLSRCSCTMAKVSAINVYLTIFVLPATRRATLGMLQHYPCRHWRDIQANHLLRNAGIRYLDWINHASGQQARSSRASIRRSSGRKISATTEQCNRPNQNPPCGCTILGMGCSRRERTTSQGPLTEIQCARLAWHYITQQRKHSWTGPSLAVQRKPASYGLFWRWRRQLHVGPTNRH